MVYSLCQPITGRSQGKKRDFAQAHLGGLSEVITDGAKSLLFFGSSFMTSRLEQRIKKTDGCWLWTGEIDAHGYGCLDKKRAHRMVFEESYGPIPAGMCVCHICDNKWCVRPDHLFLGTSSDNNKDRMRKGRSAHQKGEEHGQHKLTSGDVREILSSNLLLKEIAALYSVDQSLVSRIKRRERWTHIV